MKFHFVRFTGAFITIFMIGFLNQCKKAEEKAPNKPNFKLFTGFFNGGNHVASQDADGNIFCTYRSNFGGLGLMKISIDGQHIFTKEISTGFTTIQPSIAMTKDGSAYLLTAAYKNFSLTKYDILLVKCSSEGDTLWTRLYSTAATEFPQFIKQTRDGGLLICARTDNSGSNIALWTIKLDATGKEEWSTTPVSSGVNFISDMVELDNGDFVLLGGNNTGTTTLYKLDAAGQLVTQNNLALSNFTQAGSLIPGPDNTLLGTTTNNADVGVFKVDDKLQLVWNKQLGYSDHSEFANRMVLNKNGTITITGTTIGTKTGQTQDILVMTVSSAGDPIWYRGFGGKGNDIGMGVLKGPSGDNIIIGNTSSFTGNSSSQIFTVLMDDQGNFK